MDYIDQEILKLLKKDISLKEMESKLLINKEILWERLIKLKQLGYLFKKTNLDSGWCLYRLNKECDIDFKEDKTTEIKHKNGSVKFLVLSDLHLGSSDDRLDLINYLYSYAKNNDIHNVLIAGDFLDGIYPDKKTTKFNSIRAQADYAINNYPYYDDIHNYLLLGNHDFYSIKREGFDVSSYISKMRNDFTILGYHLANIKIRNIIITMYHPFTKDERKNASKLFEHSDIVLQGHSHHAKINTKSRPLKIILPGLLDNSFDIKGALILEVNWHHYQLDSYEVQLFSFDEKIEEHDKILIKHKK